MNTPTVGTPCTAERILLHCASNCMGDTYPRALFALRERHVQSLQDQLPAGLMPFGQDAAMAVLDSPRCPAICFTHGFFMKDGKPASEHNFFGQERFKAGSRTPTPRVSP